MSKTKRWLIIPFISILRIIHAKGDPCKDLCELVGRTICTDGSWTEPSSTCRGFFFRGASGKTEICYFAGPLEDPCSSSGIPVLQSDASEVIASMGTVLIKSPHSRPPITESDVTPGEIDWSDPISSFLGLIIGSFTGANKEATIDRIYSAFVTLVSSNSAGSRLKDLTPVQGSKLVRLHLFFARKPLGASDAVWIRVALRIAMGLWEEYWPKSSYYREYSAESGVLNFCTRNSDIILQTVISDHDHIWEFREDADNLSRQMDLVYLSKFHRFCPELVKKSHRMKQVILQHQVRKLYDTRSPKFGLKTSRSHPFRRAVRQLSNAEVESLVQPWTGVIYKRESGIGNGLIKDWYGAAATELFSEKFGLFIKVNDYYDFNPEGGNDLDILVAAGRFLALSIVNNKPIGVKLSVQVISALIKREITLADLNLQDPQMANSLNYVLKAPAEELEMMPIKFGDEFVIPTIENRADLVRRKMNFFLPGSLPFLASGFHDILISEYFDMGSLLTINDVQSILYGEPTIDIGDLEKNVVFRRYRETDREIRMLFSVLEELDNEHIKDFVRFITGYPTLPLGGFGALRPRIVIEPQMDPRLKFPRSKTCFNQLFLPSYESIDELRDNLLIALASNGEIFDYSTFTNFIYCIDQKQNHACKFSLSD
jgi:hypothetical protein